MLKQSLVQERIGDLTMNQLPPLNTLPQWSRINNLDKARYPKPFLKDKLQQSESTQEMDEDDRELGVSGMNPAQRIQYLERSLAFLRQQHTDILRALHEEVNNLKKENKDLQFKIVMSQRHDSQQGNSNRDKSQPAEGETREFSASSVQSEIHEGGNTRELESSVKSNQLQLLLTEEKLSELKVIFLEEEIKELKHALREARNRQTYMQQLLEQSEDARRKQQAALGSLKYQMSQGGGQMSQIIDKISDGQNPMQTNGRPLSLAECQAVIRHLQQINEKQAHELDTLKSDLRDVLYSHKWSPDAYLLAKAYIAEDDQKGEDIATSTTGKPGLPRIPLRNQSRKLPDIAYIQDSVSLPALKQTVGNKAVERRKRTQILQKAKLRKELVPQ